MAFGKYDAIRLGNLISDYVEYDSAKAASFISNMNIEGEELIDALDTIKLELEQNSIAYEELEEKHTELVKNLELLVKGREGSFIEKINKLLKEVKEEDSDKKKK